MNEHDTAPVEAQPAPKQASRWEDYIDVFFSPAELFRRRAADRVGPPLITLLVACLLLYLIMIPANTMIVRASIPPEQQAQMGQTGLKIATYFGGVATIIYFLASTAAAAFVMWLVGRVADLRTEFSRTMLIATYAAFVVLLMQIVTGVLLLVRGDANLDIVRDLSFGPLRFFGSREMDPLPMAALRRFELAFLWRAALWAIGIRVIYKTGWGRAILIAAITWAVMFLPDLIGAAFSGARGG